MFKLWPVALTVFLLCTSIVYAQVAPAVLTWQDNSGGPIKCPLPPAPAPNCDQEDGFDIERNVNGGIFSLLSTAPQDVTTYSDTAVYQTVGVANAFCYRVSAFNTVGTSAYTNTACKTYPALPQGQTTVNIGETVILAGSDSGNGNLLVAQYATLSQPATLRSLAFYVTAPSGSLRLGVYDATGPSGGPGAKLAETNAFVATSGWNTANVIKPVSLSSGTYWLAYLPQNNALAFVKNDVSVQPSRYYVFNFAAMPTVFLTTPSQTSSHWSLYATLSTQQFAPANAPGNLTIGTQ